MKPIDLTKQLSKYKTGWVALDKKKKVIAHAETFDAIVKKVKKIEDALLVPAAENYFGFVTATSYPNYSGTDRIL